jgi:Tol biopolymer transport system component
MSGDALLPGQTTRIRVFDVASRTARTVYETAERLYEAPNWTRDDHLLVNGDGVLWTIPVTADASRSERIAPRQIHIDGVPPLNNDHVLHPSGESVFVSANDFHLYEAPIGGGTARRITSEEGPLHFLHGVSPDGSRLAYVRLEPQGDDWWATATIHEIAADGTDDRAVTTHPGPADGAEYSPDGTWIYLNTEQFEPGRAQIARVRPDGSGLEQLTSDERVNWFPHLAPAGDRAVYLSFPDGTEGHPADREVRLVLVTGDAWSEGEVVVTCSGGQGTINVNSWSPDGTAFAYVDYPITSPAASSEATAASSAAAATAGTDATA